MNKNTFLPICALLSVAAVWAQSETVLPRDDKAGWVVGLARLADEDISPGLRYLARSVPLLIYEQMAELDSTRLTAAEVEAYRQDRVRAAEQSAVSALRSTLDRRDEVLFQQIDASSREERLAELDANLSELRERVRGLSDAVAEFAVEERKDLSFWEGHNDGRLLEPNPADPQAVARSEELDYLIWGRLEEIEGYVFTDIYVHSRFQGETVYSYADAARADEVHIIVDDAVYEIARHILGRDHAALEITSTEPDARIQIDGVTVGYGSASVRFLPVGTVTVAVTSPAGGVAHEVVRLEAAETRRIALELPAVDSRSVIVSTEPSGAGVHVGSLPVGVTPVEFPIPSYRSTVSVDLEGYREVLFTVGPGARLPGPGRAGSGDSSGGMEILGLDNQAMRDGGSGTGRIGIELVPDAIDWGRELFDRRNRFYDALAVFLVSVPVPVILGGLFQSVEAVFPDDQTGTGISPEELSRLATEGNVLYAASIGTAAISGIFLINAILEVIEYVEAGRMLAP